MILITGGAGYIGGHCALEFLNQGEKIVIFDNLENGHIETVNALKKIGDVEFVKGDLRNQEDINNLFDNFKIDGVIHFAGYIQVEESVKNPSKYYRNNIIGTLNLLDAMADHNVSKIVFSSTCAIYGEPKYVPIDEKHSKNPLNPYGKTKLIIEEILNDYETAFGIKSIKLRYFNVAGADNQIRIGEWHEPETHLIPNILKSVFEEGKTFKIYGTDYNTYDGTCIRDYVNVEDLARAHVLALKYLNENNKSDFFNIGTSKGSSVKEVFETAKEVTCRDINVEMAEPRAGDAEILIANSEKAKRLLDWEAVKTLKDSIETAYLWEKSRHS